MRLATPTGDTHPDTANASMEGTVTTHCTLGPTTTLCGLHVAVKGVMYYRRAPGQVPHIIPPTVSALVRGKPLQELFSQCLLEFAVPHGRPTVCPTSPQVGFVCIYTSLRHERKPKPLLPHARAVGEVQCAGASRWPVKHVNGPGTATILFCDIRLRLSIHLLLHLLGPF